MAVRNAIITIICHEINAAKGNFNNMEEVFLQGESLPGTWLELLTEYSEKYNYRNFPCHNSGNMIIMGRIQKTQSKLPR